MIQRIQSLFLVIAAAGFIIGFIFPVMSFLSDFNYYKLYIYEFRSMTPDSSKLFSSFFTLPLTLGYVITALLSLITIFLYKYRIKQLQLIKLAILINIILIVGIFFGYEGIISRNINIEGDFETGAFFPLITLVFLVLSYRAVRKDEKIVRAAERLR